MTFLGKRKVSVTVPKVKTIDRLKWKALNDPGRSSNEGPFHKPKAHKTKNRARGKESVSGKRVKNWKTKNGCRRHDRNEDRPRRKEQGAKGRERLNTSSSEWGNKDAGQSEWYWEIYVERSAEKKAVIGQTDGALDLKLAAFPFLFPWKIGS